MKLIYKHIDKSMYLAIPFILFGMVIIVLMIFSRFFIFGILFFWFFYFTSRKKYYRFSVYDEFIEIRNLFSKKIKYKNEFKIAKIEPGGGTMHSEKTIVLKTRDNSMIYVVPKNKSEAIKIIKILEEFGIEFLKNHPYKLLLVWNVDRAGEDGAW